MRSGTAEAFRPWRALGLAALLFTGCLPALEDACAVDEECDPDRRCVGGVCVPRAATDGANDQGLDGPSPIVDRGPVDTGGLDLARDMRPLDRALPDVAPPEEDVGLPDLGPPIDAGPRVDMDLPPDLGPEVDAGCTSQGAGCNGVDDNCNGLIDEQLEAIEACPGVLGTIQSCVEEACVYDCVEGAEPIPDDPLGRCRQPRGCELVGEWIRIAQDFEKGDDDAQQITLAADGDRRFVAAYDLLAEDAEPLVRSFVFSANAPAEAVEQRIGDPRNAHDGVLIGLTSAAVGEDFVAAAWREVDGDADDQIQLMARGGAGSPQRDFWMEWPQPPALAVLDGEPPAVVALVESHIDRDEPPMGELTAYRWSIADGAAEERPMPLAGGPRPTGPAQNAAVALPSGEVALVGDVVSEDEAGDPQYGVRVDRLSAELVPQNSFIVALPGPIVGRISIARSNTGFVVFTAIEDVALQWRSLRFNGNGFAGDPVSMRWRAAIAPQALALPGGVGAIFRDGERVRLSLPDVDYPAFEFEGHLPDSQNKVRAVAAYQPAQNVVEVVVLRDGGRMVDGEVIFGRYVCY